MDAAGVTKLLNITALVVLMISIGMTVTFREVADSAKHTSWVALGVIANFAIVPLVTVGLLAAFQPDPLVSAGFLIVAVCPGAPLGPAFARIAHGDVSMATGLMVILAGLSAIISPALLGALLHWLAPKSSVNVAFIPILLTLLLSQILPLAFGLAVRHWAPGIAQKSDKCVRSIANLLLMALIAMIILDQYETLIAIRGRAWVGMSALSVGTLAIGWACGGSHVSKQKSMALTTVTRNVAVALVIAVGSLSGTPAVTAVVAYGLFSTLVALLCAFFLSRLAVTERPIARA